MDFPRERRGRAGAGALLIHRRGSTSDEPFVTDSNEIIMQKIKRSTPSSFMSVVVVTELSSKGEIDSLSVDGAGQPCLCACQRAKGQDLQGRD